MELSKLQREPSIEELDLMIEKCFGEKIEYEYSLLKGGMFNTAYLITTVNDKKKYILRMGPMDYTYLYPYEKHLMDAECWAYERYHEIGIPTSTVVYMDTSKKLVNRDFMMVEYIESSNIYDLKLEGEYKKQLYVETGKYCRLMSDKITGKKFGRVSNILYNDGNDTWSEYIDREINEWISVAKVHSPDYYSEEELNVLSNLGKKYAKELDEITEAHFSHCDIWGANLLQNKNEPHEIVAVIDPDRGVMGDPMFEIASGWMINDDFYEGYGKRPDDDRNTKIRISIYKIIFCLLDGFFQLIQYDNERGAAWDKNSVLKSLEIINSL